VKVEKDTEKFKNKKAVKFLKKLLKYIIQTLPILYKLKMNYNILQNIKNYMNMFFKMISKILTSFIQ